MKKINISLKWKIFSYLFVFSSILLMFLWVFQVIFLDDFYKMIRTNEVNKSINLILNNVENKEFYTIADSLSQNQEIFLTIKDLDDKIIYTNNLNEYKKDVQQNSNGMSGSEPSQNIKRRLHEEMQDPKEKHKLESIKKEKIITISNGNKIKIIVNAVVSPVNSTVSTLRIQFLCITLFMIIFSIALALIISKRISKPIEKINYSAKILAKGQYDIEFNGYGFKEITELSNTLNFTAKELSKVENLRKELIANVSHDLRTPLTLISGYAEIMRDLPEENNAENAQIIIDETKRLTVLVNDMLDTSKIQSGIDNINKSKYNLTVSINAVISRVSELVKSQGYDIQFNFDEEVYVNADEIKISQVFYNLLINAINYTGKDKFVEIRQSIDNNKVKIEVIDTGDGIEKVDLPYIWDRYYKVDKNHKRAVTGSGLGLSIVKNIIDLHDGKYGVDSKIGIGSNFWFSLEI